MDQSLDVGAFGQVLASARGALMGPAYLDVWDQFRAGFHAEVLPKAAQELVRSTSRPRQELLLGYWRLALDGGADEFVASAHEAARVIGASGTPYVHVAGAEPGSAYRAWLAGTLPQARIEVWPASGHFPHLAHPRRFARLLAETATWTPGVERLAA